MNQRENEVYCHRNPALRNPDVFPPENAGRSSRICAWSISSATSRLSSCLFLNRQCQGRHSSAYL